MLQLLLGLFMLGITVRFAGANGRDRFLALPERRAQGVREHFTSRLVEWFLLGGIAIALVDVALGVYLGSWVYLTLSALALGAFGVVRALRPRATATVEAAYAERDLEPLLQRESSARRDRRQKQLGLTFLVLFLTGRVLDVAAEETASRLPELLMVPTTALMFVVGFTLLWSTAWRFGDERPQ